MENKDKLGDRIERFEDVSDVSLMIRTPVIIRLDGKDFHSLTKGMVRPFDHRFVHCMNSTAFKLSEKLAGARLVYSQSDEISIFVADYTRLETQPWLGDRFSKLISITASIATQIFNEEFKRTFKGTKFEKRIGLFNARAFNLPRHEVYNYFVWRQNNCITNSISAYAQSLYSAAELHNKAMLTKLGMIVNRDPSGWKSLDNTIKYGICVRKHKTQGWYFDFKVKSFLEDRYIIRLTK